MTSQERLRTVLAGGVPDRVPYVDSFWTTTVERWRREGLPERVSPGEHFGCEMARIGGDYTLQYPVKVVEETERDRTYVDENGAMRKDLNTSDGWTPHWLSFSVNGRDDWERVKERGMYNPSRIPDHAMEAYRRARAKGRFIVYSSHACFHPTWQKVGMETMFVWMHEQPDLVADMYATHTQMVIDLYDGMVAQGIDFDALWFSDDLGYRNAPLISPAMYADLVKPYHKQLCDHAADAGLPVILHSDGDVRSLIPHFLEAGLTALHPLEAKAGLDVRELKPQYEGRLVLFGNIDARMLAGTADDVVAEVEAKVGAAKEGGGYIFHTDHSVPNDVSLSNYRLALETLERCGRYS